MSTKAGEYEWTCVTNKAPYVPRDGAGALVFNGRMWLIGGWNPWVKPLYPGDCNSEIWSSDDGAHWTLECREAPWECRHTAGYVVHRDRMWVVGGDPIQKHYQPDVWSSEDGIHWDCVCRETPWGQRVLHYTAAFNGRIWVMGGQTLPQCVPGQEVFHNNVWCSEDGAHWTRVLMNAPWSPRGLIGGSAVFRHRLWLIGGGTYETAGRPETGVSEVWSSADGIQWDCHTDSVPWLPRIYHDVAVFDDKLWLMEGSRIGKGNGNDVWFSADGIRWEELPGTPWAPRHAASVFVHHGCLWLAAGNNMDTLVWKLTRRGSG